MRLLLLMLGISVCVVCIGTRAEAQNYPWCAIYSGGAVSGGTNCGFVTFERAWSPRAGSAAFAIEIRNTSLHPDHILTLGKGAIRIDYELAPATRRARRLS